MGVEFQSIVVYLIFHLYASSAQIAHEAAGIVLVNSNLTDLLVAIDLARTIYSRIRLNLMWALCYNSIGIPVAAGVLYPMTHEALPPYVAALAMALSSVSVLTSSLSLSARTSSCGMERVIVCRSISFLNRVRMVEAFQCFPHIQWSCPSSAARDDGNTEREHAAKT